MCCGNAASIQAYQAIAHAQRAWQCTKPHVPVPPLGTAVGPGGPLDNAQTPLQAERPWLQWRRATHVGSTALLLLLCRSTSRCIPLCGQFIGLDPWETPRSPACVWLANKKLGPVNEVAPVAPQTLRHKERNVQDIAAVHFLLGAGKSPPLAMQTEHQTFTTNTTYEK